MTVSARLNRLELKVGQPDCECRRQRIAVVYVDVEDPVPVPETCLKCGRDRRTIIVMYVPDNSLLED